MALLDFLKKKEDIKKSNPIRKPSASNGARKPGKKSEKVSVEKKEEIIKVQKTKGKNEKFSYEAIRQPHISEKASYLAEKDQYIFIISPNYNKNEVKKAVEGLYGVDVLSVNVVKIPSKKRRLGKTEGFRKAYKKAIVKIKNGQKIEIL